MQKHLAASTVQSLGAAEVPALLSSLAHAIASARSAIDDLLDVHDQAAAMQV